jgi:hypothetical protein
VLGNVVTMWEVLFASGRCVYSCALGGPPSWFRKCHYGYLYVDHVANNISDIFFMSLIKANEVK